MDNTALILQELSAAFTTIPFNKMLGLKLEQVDPQHVVISFEMKNELVGNFVYGILHGGVISSVLDMVGGMLVMTAAAHQHPNASLEELGKVVSRCSTVDLNIQYLRKGAGKSFIAKSSLLKFGQHLVFTRMELYNEQQLLIATASGTYMQS